MKKSGLNERLDVIIIIHFTVTYCIHTFSVPESQMAFFETIEIVAVDSVMIFIFHD